VRAIYNNIGQDADLSDRRRRDLAAGVLKQAVRDLRRFRNAKSGTARELYLDAELWLTANDFSWPFSFLNVCQTLGLEPETLRQDLLDDLWLGTFNYWMRQCGRAARRSRLSLTQLFAPERRIEASAVT
jgi:hypothetical protein